VSDASISATRLWNPASNSWLPAGARQGGTNSGRGSCHDPFFHVQGSHPVWRHSSAVRRPCCVQLFHHEYAPTKIANVAAIETGSRR
jgi:hypothetical protein